ncbi:MAG: YbhB/YbcL family Raf kinase inhibitor-like protein [Alphaproteobacteria bacterium]|nr:YbhB/YbcL family Raf kinase inhibitor-like protein [Rickettsiales bacterium]
MLNKLYFTTFVYSLLLTLFSTVLPSNSFGAGKFFTKIPKPIKTISISETKIQLLIDSNDIPYRKSKRDSVQFIPEMYAFNIGHCGGKNISPNIKWKILSENKIDTIKSYAVTMYSPNSNTGSGWWHWIVHGIPASVNEIETGTSKFGEKEIINSEGEVVGVTEVTDSNNFGYSGPCPLINSLWQEYIFTVYALNVKSLPVSDRFCSQAMIRASILKHTIASTSLKGYY